MNNKEPVFYYCEDCNLILEAICGNKEEGLCGKFNLKKLEANRSDGAAEKHIPEVETSGNKVIVRVGSIAHPMTEEHSITWVYLQTKHGSQRAYLNPDQEPAAEFLIADGDEAVAAYAYCNLHGFWKQEL